MGSLRSAWIMDRSISEARRSSTSWGSMGTNPHTRTGSDAVEAADEDAQTIEQAAFVIVEELIRPVDGRLQRLVAGCGARHPGVEETKPIVEAL
jgi:hypothetical protein